MMGDHFKAQRGHRARNIFSRYRFHYLHTMIACFVCICDFSKWKMAGVVVKNDQDNSHTTWLRSLWNTGCGHGFSFHKNKNSILQSSIGMLLYCSYYFFFKSVFQTISKGFPRNKIQVYLLGDKKDSHAQGIPRRKNNAMVFCKMLLQPTREGKRPCVFNADSAICASSFPDAARQMLLFYRQVAHYSLFQRDNRFGLQQQIRSCIATCALPFSNSDSA